MSWEIGTLAPLLFAEPALTCRSFPHFDFVRLLNNVQVYLSGHTFMNSASVSKSRSVKLAPVRILLVANPVIRQSIWLKDFLRFSVSLSLTI